MPEISKNPKRLSPLENIALPGKYGAINNETPGVILSVCPARSVVSIGARKNMEAKVSAVFKKQYALIAPKPGRSEYTKNLAVHWAGPEQWYVITNSCEEGTLYDKLAKQFSGIASIIDQSHGRVTIKVSGRNACDLMAKGTPVDLHKNAFTKGCCAVTEMAHITVHLAEIADDEFEVSVFRGFAESFWQWLTEMSLEFGYEVK